MCVAAVAGVVSVACSEVGKSLSVDPCPVVDVDDACDVGAVDAGLLVFSLIASSVVDVDDACDVGVVDAGLLVVSLIASSVVDENCVKPLVVTILSV